MTKQPTNQKTKNRKHRPILTEKDNEDIMKSISGKPTQITQYEAVGIAVKEEPLASGATCKGSPTSSGIRGFSDQMVCDDEDEQFMNIDDWIDVKLKMILDSGYCDHVMDAEDAPRYVVMEYLGSRRGQNFSVGNGEEVNNEGRVQFK